MKIVSIIDAERGDLINSIIYCCVFVLFRYILELHRIPPSSNKTPKKVVLLMHGVVESSGTWLVNPYSRSLGIVFHNI